MFFSILSTPIKIKRGQLKTHVNSQKTIYSYQNEHNYDYLLQESLFVLHLEMGMEMVLKLSNGNQGFFENMNRSFEPNSRKAPIHLQVAPCSGEVFTLRGTSSGCGRRPRRAAYFNHSLPGHTSQKHICIFYLATQPIRRR